VFFHREWPVIDGSAMETVSLLPDLERFAAEEAAGRYRGRLPPDARNNSGHDDIVTG
jgi:hypothetical protein